MRSHFDCAHGSDTEIGPVLLNLSSRDTIRQSHANFAHFTGRLLFFLFPTARETKENICFSHFSMRIDTRSIANGTLVGHASYASVQITQN